RPPPRSRPPEVAIPAELRPPPPAEPAADRYILPGLQAATHLERHRRAQRSVLPATGPKSRAFHHDCSQNRGNLPYDKGWSDGAERPAASPDKKLPGVRTGIAPQQATRKRLLYLPSSPGRFKEIETHVAEECIVSGPLPAGRRSHCDIALATRPSCS